MADSSILKEFLVSLGFKVDTTSETKFKESVKAATDRIKDFGVAMTATATLAMAGITKIASSLEDLYYVTERTKASSDNIKAFEFAVSQLGGTADGARGSLESLARNLRNSPGYYGMLEGLGVQTKQANGQLRDTVDIVQDLGARLKAMPYYQANSYANALGIDEKTLMAMRDGSLVSQMQRYRQISREIGIDQDTAAVGARDFMQDMRELYSIMQLVLFKVGGELMHVIHPALGAVEDMIIGAVKWFRSLSPEAKGAIRLLGTFAAGWVAFGATAGLAIKALTLAWSGLNLAMLASPIAWVLALAAAVALLWDDYQTWKDGGQSLIDWSSWSGDIENAIGGIGDLRDAFGDLGGAFKDLGQALEKYLKPVGKWIGEVFGETLRGVIRNIGELAHGLAALLRGDTDGASTHGSNILENARTAFNHIGESTREMLGMQPYQGGKPPAGQPAKKPAAPQQAQSAPAAAAAGGQQLPRGIRNNNPGNLNFAHQAQATRETRPDGTKGRFAAFPDAQTGLNALSRQLQLYSAKGLKSVSQMIEKFAPKEENNTKAYIAKVSKALGVTKTDSLNMSDPTVVRTMMDAIIKVENGYNPYSREMVAAAANKNLPAAPTLNQTTNVTINGVTQPQETAQAVAGAQNDVNALLIRNLRPAAR
ncbi:hypothetical protein [Chromobacterium subtsugae]|uniref:hypothetical protein n=1 Tax=Chromobacterium subtsugae TaxID=251747 RepID=UPI000640E528|nr:hypothetical protein [Chromobacterium subtsugae]